MEENETNKPHQGTYDEMTPSSERKPKVEFEIGKSVAVQFSSDFKKPREFPSSEKGVYYLFDCYEEGKEKIFMTAAWSLLQGLKNAEPLAGKNLLISKKLVKGKQNYSVEEITDDEVPVERPGEEDSEEAVEEKEDDKDSDEEVKEESEEKEE